MSESRSSSPSAAARSVFFFGSFGGILAGYDQGIAAGSLLFIGPALQLTPWTKGLVVSSLMFGAILGSLVAGALAERWGRRPILQLAAAVFGLSAIGMAVAPGVATLVAARVLGGLAVGIASVVVPTYLSELAPTRNRGGIATLNQLMIAIGIFAAYLTSLLLSPWGAWRWMLGIALIPSLLLLIGVSRSPETPRWLVAHGRPDEARRVLGTQVGEEEADGVLADIQRTKEAEPAGDRARWRELLTPALRRPLLIAVGLALLQQFIGINTIVYYAPTILQAAGFGDSAALLNSVGLGALSIVTTLVTARVVDSVGRRRLLLIGGTAMLLSMTVLAVLFGGELLGGVAGAAGAVICLAVFKVAFSLSWGPLMWVLLPEQFPLRVRTMGVGVGSFVNWTANLLVSQFFPVLLVFGAGAVFGIFAGFAVLALVFTYFCVRETSRRSLEDLELAG
ncbi:sugar porter family MFS transporter [Saccharopolyspora gloriosae]|uniref:Sugar porter (SP) family MFS transporter n=1 Tax=Saccharopolyspora gloriosae TaxID=455344 RepID=A0A840NKS9_9PSEU|nr:sugar porter family MFS transporter [Saccharopolyspora gloriosae]MBB5070928.1 sugar porter (SP) family MFS transporter [Saccharopolyspora gloriosae]